MIFSYPENWLRKCQRGKNTADFGPAEVETGGKNTFGGLLSVPARSGRRLETGMRTRVDKSNRRFALDSQGPKL